MESAMKIRSASLWILNGPEIPDMEQLMYFIASASLNYRQMSTLTSTARSL